MNHARAAMSGLILALTTGFNLPRVPAAQSEPEWSAQWIWRAMAAGEDDYNRWILARHEFDVSGAAQRARLRVSADTRYQLFINGEFVVDGPVKAHPEAYRYDTVDVTRFLRSGPNVLAARVHHWGRDTAQNIAVRPGLLVQLDWNDERGRQMVGTDAAWRVVDDSARDIRSPQVSAHLGFEEQVDARLDRTGWMTAGFDASGWEAADAFAGAADGPWLNVQPSGIPPLAKMIHPAISVMSVRHVRPPRVVATINVGRRQGIDRKADNRSRHRFVLAGILRSDRDQEAVLLRPSAGFIFGVIRIGGEATDVEKELLTPERKAIRLKKGDTPVIVALDGMSEIEEHQFVLDAEAPVELRAAFGGGPWSLAGPFPLKDADWPRISAAATLDDLAPFRSRFRDLDSREIISADVHALTSHRVDLGPAQRIQSPQALAGDHEADAVIPAGDEAVEWMIDLGEEYNAHMELQLQAPAGVILDGNIFERFHDHAPQWSWRNRSSFRYVTRDGWQTHRTMPHYGGRYLALTVRARSAEVRIRRVRAIATHYPVADRGAFFSSDHLLNSVWRVCRRTMLSCMEDTFVDCPLYEQSYWLGDARNEALVSYAMFGDAALVRRCCDLGGESLARGDLAAMRVPTRWPRIIPAWSFLWLRMCWENYEYTGDRAALTAVDYPRIRTMLDTCLDTYIDAATGLFSITAWQFFDWISGLDTGHRIVTHNNTFLADSLRIGARMADLAGEPAVAGRYRAAADDLARRINEHLWDEARGAYIDSIHNDGKRSPSVSRQFNTLALLHGVVPADREAKVLAVALGEKTDGVVQFGSPFATLYLLELLGETGRIGVMLDVIRDLWGGMLDAQTTTFWESFPSGNLGGGRYPTRSYCHAWSSGPAYVFSRYVMGAKIEAPGGTQVSLTPRVDCLERVEGVIPLPNGEIRMAWTRAEDGAADLSIEPSPGIRTTLHPPEGWRIESGKAAALQLNPGTRHALRLVPADKTAP